MDEWNQCVRLGGSTVERPIRCKCRGLRDTQSCQGMVFQKWHVSVKVDQSRSEGAVCEKWPIETDSYWWLLETLDTVHIFDILDILATPKFFQIFQSASWRYC